MLPTKDDRRARHSRRKVKNERDLRRSGYDTDNRKRDSKPPRNITRNGND